MPSKAQKLLNRMRASQANWKRSDLDHLYLGFGFIIENGASHDIVKHPSYPFLRTTLPRHNELAKAYIFQAIKLIDQLQKLEQTRE